MRAKLKILIEKLEDKNQENLPKEQNRRQKIRKNLRNNPMSTTYLMIPDKTKEKKKKSKNKK